MAARTWARIGVGLALAGALVGCQGGDPPAQGPPPLAVHPDVLLVVLDTVRADHLGTYGYARPTSRQLDLVAEAGVVFEDVTSSGGWTWPAHASLFTGEPPWVHGAHRVPAASAQVAVRGMTLGSIAPGVPTLAERLSAGGYRAVSLSANTWLAPELGLTRGFERAMAVDRDDRILEAAEAAMQEADPRPLFLFVNLMAAHNPLHATPAPWAKHLGPLLADKARAPAWAAPFLTTDKPGLDIQQRGPDGIDLAVGYYTGRIPLDEQALGVLTDLYDAGVSMVDYELSLLLADWGRTHPHGVVVITSDHGEHLGDRRLLGHGWDLYPPITRVALALAAPGRLPPGRRVRAPVSLDRVAPTILDLAGVAPGDPRSLVPVVEGGGASEPVRAGVWVQEGDVAALGGVFARSWMLWREGDEAVLVGSGGERSLHDLRSDPQMERDLGPERPARLAELAARAEVGLTAEVAPAAGPVATPRPETVEALKAMGYLER